MARPAKYNADQMLDTALELLVEGGLRGVSVAAIARRLGAPSGSVYHRFPSRELLLARLWLRTVARFQRGYVEALGSPPALEPAVRHVLQFCRSRPSEARLLLLHRRQDFVEGDWPDDVRSVARKLADDLTGGLRSLGATLEVDAALLRLAAISIPQGAVTPYLRAGESIPRHLDDAVVRASTAALASGTMSPHVGGLV